MDTLVANSAIKKLVFHPFLKGAFTLPDPPELLAQVFFESFG